MSWLKIKKNVVLKCHLIYSTQQTISQSDCDVWQRVLYDNRWQPAQWLDWEVPSSCQGQTCTRKGAVGTVWWSAASLIHYSFLNPGKTMPSDKYAQQIDEIHWKLQGLQQHWSTERAQFFSTTPVCMLPNQRFKSWTNWAMQSCLTRLIHLTSCQWVIYFNPLDNLLQAKRSTTSRRQKMLSKSSSNPEARIPTL